MNSQETAHDLLTSQLETLREQPLALRPLLDDIDVDDQLGFKFDKSSGFTPYTKQIGNKATDVDYADAGNEYFISADNPIIDSQASANDRKQRNLEEVQPWNKEFYSAAKFYPRAKEQHRNYMVVVNFIFKNKDNKKALRAGWNRFWKRWNEQGLDWISPRQMKCIRNTFNNHGIYKKGDPRNQD